jgi:glutamate racemase
MRWTRTIIALAIAACAAAPAAYAHDTQNMTPRPISGVVADQARKPCECRARGQIFITGEQTCLNGMVAVCDMDQNVTTWRMTGQTCPQS